MRLTIGFILGLCATALAQELPRGSGNIDTVTIGPATLMAGTNPDGWPAPIKVDRDGHVICSH